MRDDIKERIELIKGGMVPEGYKKTNQGIVSLDFDEIALSEIGEFKNGINFSKGNGDNVVQFLGVGDFGELSTLNNTDNLAKIYVEASDEQLSSYFLKDDDIVFVRSNGSKELVGRNLLVKNPVERVVYSGFCIRYRMHSDNKSTTMSYINAWLENGALKTILKRENRGTNINNLNQKILSKLKIYIPSIEEQDKILKILKKYEDYAELLRRLTNKKIRRFEWLSEQLLSGKLRISNNTDKWKNVKIRQFIREINEKTTQNNQYEILSVTKSGICLQKEQFNKQIASNENIGYKVVKKGNLVFSTMNLWMGSLDVLDSYSVGIVSPAYKVFKFNNDVMLSEFGKYYMKTKHMIWKYEINSEQGASIVRRNLDLKGLLNNTVSIPEVCEQRKIAEVLAVAEKEIKLLEEKMKCVQQEKSVMMKLLLSGIVRVNK